MDWLSPIKPVFESALSSLNFLSAIRALVGFVLVFFLPGFAWTFIFFKQITVLERIALSFGLSIAIVTMSITVLNVLIGVRITGLNSLLIILFITIVPIVLYYLMKLIKKRLSAED